VRGLYLLTAKPMVYAAILPLTAPHPPLPALPSRAPCSAVRGLYLLTAKPMVYAANVAEDDLASPEGNKFVQALRAKAGEEGSDVVVVSAQVGGCRHGWVGGWVGGKVQTCVAACW
jgi:hypothetical protein